MAKGSFKQDIISPRGVRTKSGGQQTSFVGEAYGGKPSARSSLVEQTGLPNETFGGSPNVSERTAMFSPRGSKKKPKFRV